MTQQLPESISPAMHGILLGIAFALMMYLSRAAIAATPDCPINTACLDWVAPTENVDGTEVAGISAYRLYIGTQSGQYNADPLTVASGDTSYSFDLSVPNGEQFYFFAVTAINDFGQESAFSNEVMHHVVFIEDVPPNPPTSLQLRLRVQMTVPGGVIVSE